MRFLTLACCLSFSAWAAAQDVSGLSEYQQGAGAYFAGRSDQAEEHLSAAIESDPNDIRAYYLRGLNRMNAGNLAGAQADLTKGAELEAQRGASPLVDQSLAAVQGSSRVTLERIRRAARRSAELAERRAIWQARRQYREEQEQRVLRTNYELPIEALASRLTVEQARQVASKSEPSSVADVVAADSAPTAEIVSDSDNPFADDTYGEDSTVAATSPAGTTTMNDVDIPEAARGTIDTGMLMEIVGDVVGQAFSNGTDVVSGVVPPMPPMGPGGTPPGMMGGGENEFGDPSGGQGFPAGGQGFPIDGQGFPADEQGFPAGDDTGMDAFSDPQFDAGDDSFAVPEEENPFDFAE